MQDGWGIENQLYYASLISRINKNWSLPEGLLKGKDISAVIVIHIIRNGRIVDAKFEQKSGIEAFDQEVLRTLKKSDPLPPLPEGFPKNIFDVGLTFSRKGLSRK
jgi:TonB family protein